MHRIDVFDFKSFLVKWLKTKKMNHEDDDDDDEFELSTNRLAEIAAELWGNAFKKGRRAFDKAVSVVLDALHAEERALKKALLIHIRKDLLFLLHPSISLGDYCSG